MTSPNTVAVMVANNIINVAAQVIQNIYDQIVIIDSQWTDDNVATLLANMNTAVLNADGTLGSQDASPNSAHPILNVNYPPLSRPLTATQITQMKSALDDIKSYLNGNAVSANPGAHAILDVAVGG